MPYCPRCGVEVEDRMEHCPLCETAIPQGVRNQDKAPAPYPEDIVPPRKMYKRLSEKQLHWFVLSLIILLGLLPVLIISAIDLLNNGRFTWSYYAIVGILGTAGIVYLFVRYPRRPMIAVNGTFLSVFAVNMLVGYRYAPVEFFSSVEFIFYGLTFVIGESVLIFLTGKKRKWYDIVSFCLLMVTFFLLLVEYSLSKGWAWSLICASAILPVMLYFFYAGRAKRRGLNLVGFFFLLLTLMLLALDLTTTFQGWSVITSMIFGFLTLAFYIMHIALFNDTDWKKALHL